MYSLSLILSFHPIVVIIENFVIKCYALILLCSTTMFYVFIHSSREEDSLVDMFVIEMLVVMIESLRLAHKDDKSLG